MAHLINRSIELRHTQKSIYLYPYSREILACRQNVFRVYIVRTTFTTPAIDRFTSVYPSTLGYEVTNWQLSCQLIKVALLTQSIMWN